MRVLFLGAPDSPLVSFLREQGESVIVATEPLSAPAVAAAGHEILVSYGYRHILREDILGLFPGRAVNLHISLLPWNRGADPNLWSFLEGTPKGVTIHRLDKGVDTGDVLVQKEVAMPPGATLRTSYDLLQREIQDLFRENWPLIKNGKLPGRTQTGPATMHRTKDKAPHEGALRLGFDTPVAEIAAYGRERGLTVPRLPDLLLRADGSGEIGFGHVMRCLTLGREWARRGGRTVLLSSRPTESVKRRAESFGITVREVERPHPDAGDAAAVAACAGPGSWIVVDGYRFDEAYLSAIRSGGRRVLAIDDGVRLKRYDADLVLDQNLGAERRDYGVKSLLGTRYALLRPELAERQRPKRTFHGEARRLLITLGGGDSARGAASALDALGASASGLEIVVAVGPDSPAPAPRPGVRIERGGDLAALLEWADFGILAGGTTSWEAAYMALPAVYAPLADNQRPIAHALAEAGAGLEADYGPALAEAAGVLRRDAARRASVSAAAAALVDGRGAARVCDTISSFPEPACS